MKNVLGLIISERRLGNTEVLVKEIMASIPEKCNYELIRLTNLQIKPCKACYRCLSADTVCSINDDFNSIFNKIIRADAIIIGFPVYSLGPHGYYKMLTDRLIGAFNHAEFTSGKPCILVSPFGREGWEGYTKTAALVLPRILQLKVVDYWQVQAALPGESLLSPTNLEYAHSLGKRLLNGPAYKPGAWECPRCGSDLFRLCKDNGAECALCKTKGVLRAGGPPVFPESQEYRFSPAHIKAHFGDWLVGMKQDFKKQRERLKTVQNAYRDMNWWVKL